MNSKSALFIIFFLFIYKTNAQFEPRSLEAKRTSKTIKIDGKLNEDAWNDAAKAIDFVEFRPNIGKKDSLGNHTEAYIMYDDLGIYFGGTCYESNLSQISKELVGRDGFGANDYIGLAFDTYNDKLNGFEYFLTPLGEQWDAKMTSNQNSDNGGEDFSWNAVWQSNVIIHDKGWTFEMFLPFSAIRFSKEKIQDWGINITRRRRKTERQNTWSPINPTVNGFLTQAGTWKGISDIKPPIRFQLFPYFSVYGNHFPANSSEVKNWTSQESGGLDLKLGLSESFTLDATLIPDFGQVQSDNQVLNLSPFEVRYNENRPFFTEGTELFSKGNLFYSRRIGGRPIHLDNAYEAVNDKEKIKENPQESKLINATKISGRTQSGLGIGILNAVTKAQFATIENNENGEIRKYETDPATNYNILVLDQTMKYNSSISLINTSVLRASGQYNANVSAGMFSVNNKKNSYNLAGSAFVSKLNYKNSSMENQVGYSHNLHFGKTSGVFNFNINQDLTDTKFNSNDLGYFTNNNFIDHGLHFGYRIIKPKSWYNRLNFNVFGRTSNLFSKIGDHNTKFQRSRLNFNVNAQTKSGGFVGIFSNIQSKSNDFYEPRIAGKMYVRGGGYAFGGWFSNNSANKYSINTEYFRYNSVNFYGVNSHELGFNHTLRFNSKFSIRHSYFYDLRPRALGFAATLDNNLAIFGLRRNTTTENTLTLKYNFTNKMGLSLRIRHYNSLVENKQFFTLNDNGTLQTKIDNTENLNRNANFFNIDMVYTWQFAPGSFINVVWKDASSTETELATNRYFQNLGDITNANTSQHNNNISFKIIYFIDYLTFKKKIG